MPVDINSVTVVFGNGQKREDYGPVKKAEVSITAAVASGEDGTVVLHTLGTIAVAQVARLLDAPKPDTVASASIQEANQTGEPPARRGRPPKAAPAADVAQQPAAETAPPASEPGTEAGTPAGGTDTTTDEWSTTAEEAQVTDKELLDSTSAAAGRLGDREKVKTLIATFNDKPEGQVFKVQDIPQALRRDYLTKLAALT